MNTKMAASLITSIMTFLQMHSEKKATTAKTSSAATTAKMQLQSKTGILSLPNQCVREENMGSGMVIAINVENPNLFEWAYNAMLKAPRPSLPLPEVLAAIMPFVAGTCIYTCTCTEVYEKQPRLRRSTWHLPPTTHALIRSLASPVPIAYSLHPSTLPFLPEQSNQRPALPLRPRMEAVDREAER